MEGALDDLLRHPALWQGARAVGGAADGGACTVPTGFAPLDDCLPGGGWPLGALVEILHDTHGIGELSLLLPALAQLARDGRWLAWIAPPWELAAPALQAGGVDPARVLVVRGCTGDEALWAGEQALRSGACGGVLLWPGRLSGGKRRGGAFRELRRLQLAAEAGSSLGVLFRDAAMAASASPAALRLRLAAGDDGLRVEVLKSRGGRRATLCLEPGAMGPGAMPLPGMP